MQWGKRRAAKRVWRYAHVDSASGVGVGGGGRSGCGGVHMWTL